MAKKRGRRSGRVERDQVPYPYRYQRIRCGECGVEFVLGESPQSEGFVGEDGCAHFMARCVTEGCSGLVIGVFGGDPAAVAMHRDNLTALGSALAAGGTPVQMDVDERLNGVGRVH